MSIVLVPLFIATIFGLLFGLVWAVNAALELMNHSKLATAVGCISIAALSCWASMPPLPLEKTPARLIEQVQGKSYYWNSCGEEISDWDWYRHNGYHQEYAAYELGRMGRSAREALPYLKAELAGGVENIDTGDGMIHLRTAIETAILMIESDQVDDFEHQVSHGKSTQ